MSKDPPTSNKERIDWTEVIEKMTDDLERTRNLLETKTAAWRGAIEANGKLHEKIARHETTIRRLADDAVDMDDQMKGLKAEIERLRAALRDAIQDLEDYVATERAPWPERLNRYHSVLEAAPADETTPRLRLPSNETLRRQIAGGGPE